MFNKRRDELSNGAGSSDIFGTRRKASDKVLATIVRNNTVDEGISAFTLWLGVNGKNSAAIPITMKQFRSGTNNKVVVSLRDNILQKDIHVGIVDGIPFCNGCRSNDCAHIGFAVCAEQLNLRSKLE
ncbi:MAG TPA: hypothetical protein VE264_04490 [Nitrososphaera sp.]|jgi:hypothetical protein|nr:hypothetical protein [Nitrososphaera sp.]